MDLPEEPLQVGPGDMLRQFMASLPPDLRAAAADYPDGQFERQLEADIRQVDEQFAAIMPPRATPE